MPKRSPIAKGFKTLTERDLEKVKKNAEKILFQLQNPPPPKPLKKAKAGIGIFTRKQLLGLE